MINLHTMACSTTASLKAFFLNQGIALIFEKHFEAFKLLGGASFVNRFILPSLFSLCSLKRNK